MTLKDLIEAFHEARDLHEKFLAEWVDARKRHGKSKSLNKSRRHYLGLIHDIRLDILLQSKKEPGEFARITKEYANRPRLDP